MLALVVGFTVSATLVFALVGSAGRTAAASGLGLDVSLVVGLIVLAILDLAYPRLRCPTVRRQTPKDLVGRFSPGLGGFLWGLDTGSVFSTFRASCSSWAALAVVFVGWVPIWSGIVYAAAFSAPLAALIAAHNGRALNVLPKEDAPALSRFLTANGGAVALKLTTFHRSVQVVSAAMLATAAVLVAIDVVSR